MDATANTKIHPTNTFADPIDPADHITARLAVVAGNSEPPFFPAVQTGSEPGATLHTGGCHCGLLRFEVKVDATKGNTRCNCSICTKLAATATMVKPAAFRLISEPSDPDIGRYEWASKIGQRYFCKRCGVYCFARGNIPELGGDYVSVNLNAFDKVDPSAVMVHYWDGRHDNWYAGARPTPWPMFLPPADAEMG